MPNLKSVEHIQDMNPNDFFSRDLCRNTYLHSIAKNPILLKAAFAMLSPNQLQQASIIKNKKNETLLHLAAATLDSLELVLDLYDKEGKYKQFKRKTSKTKPLFFLQPPLLSL